MLNLERHEKNAIRLAQRKTKSRKENDRIVSCPFVDTIDSMKRIQWFGNVAHDVCVLCHKWMGTDFGVYTHPCNGLQATVVRERFWRNPDYELILK